MKSYTDNLNSKGYAAILISILAAYYISGYFFSQTSYRVGIAALGIPVGYLLNQKVYPKLTGSDSSDSEEDG
jgi:hypothetical protein